MTTITITPVHAGKVLTNKALRFGMTEFEIITGGVGGWETVDRPHRAAAAAWVGGTARTLELPLILDGVDAYGPNNSRVIDADCARVNGWGLEDAKLGEPPLLRVAGLVTVPASHRWVVEDIAWGPYMTKADGRRIQQELTLTLLRHREPKLSKGPAKKSRQRKGKRRDSGRLVGFNL